jgi:hypothetical protein
MAFDKRMLKGRFGAKRNEVPGEWRLLRSDKLHNLFSSKYINRKIK